MKEPIRLILNLNSNFLCSLAGLVDVGDYGVPPVKRVLYRIFAFLVHDGEVCSEIADYLGRHWVITIHRLLSGSPLKIFNVF